jgi:hypothetical protein
MDKPINNSIQNSAINIMNYSGRKEYKYLPSEQFPLLNSETKYISLVVIGLMFYNLQKINFAR